MLADPHYATVTANRGNATKVSRWLNVASPASLNGAHWIDTTRTYDQVGNLKLVTSPRLNTTTYDYTDSFTSTPTLSTGTKTWA